MQLHFFAKSEARHFNEVNGFSAEVFDDFVANRQGF
jgi:hypothetical protein